MADKLEFRNSASEVFQDVNLPHHLTMLLYLVVLPKLARRVGSVQSL
jgi:hypothetical protein